METNTTRKFLMIGRKRQDKDLFRLISKSYSNREIVLTNNEDDILRQVKFYHFQFDLIIIINGCLLNVFELIKKFKSHYFTIPVFTIPILLIGNEPPPENILNNLVDGFVKRPVDGEKLTTEIKRLIDQRKPKLSRKRRKYEKG